jgi:hypothetical protein
MAIFKLYVGWKKVAIFRSDDIEYLSFKKRSISQQTRFSNIKVVEAMNLYAYDRIPVRGFFDLRYSNRSHGTRYDTALVVLKDVERQDPIANNNNNNYILEGNRDMRSQFRREFLGSFVNPNFDWAKQSIVGLIPIGDYSVNAEKFGEFYYYRLFPFLSLFLGSGTKMRHPYGKTSTITGRDASKYFIEANVSFSSEYVMFH